MSLKEFSILEAFPDNEWVSWNLDRNLQSCLHKESKDTVWGYYVSWKLKGYHPGKKRNIEGRFKLSKNSSRISDWPLDNMPGGKLLEAHLRIRELSRLQLWPTKREEKHEVPNMIDIYKKFTANIILIKYWIFSPILEVSKGTYSHHFYSVFYWRS